MIIFGTRAMSKVLAIVTFVCSNCHNPAAQRVIQRTTWFTLFFIPVFPVHKLRASTCTFCGASFKIDKQTAEQYVQMGAGGAPQHYGQPGPVQPGPAQPAPTQYNPQFQPQQQYPTQPPHQG